MKKFFTLLIIFSLSIGMSFAKSSNKDYKLSFNGNRYYLLYSIKNNDFGGYLNEYYKKGETYNIWTELIAVHHFPNAYSPIDRIKDFKDYLGSMQVPSSLTFDDKKNTAMIDFVMIQDKKMPIILEFNVFKYEKSKKCGSIAIQYAKRYSATTTMQIEEIKKDFAKNRRDVIKKLKNFNIPEVITVDIDKCISASDIIEKNKEENQAETLAEKNETAEQTELADITENSDNNSTENESENATDIKNETLITEENSVNSDEKTDNELVEIEIDEPELTDVTDNSTTISENETIQEEKNEIKENIATYEEAPTPEKFNNTDDKIKKDGSYKYFNNKDDYIATPRTKKELKAEIKKKRHDQKLAEKNSKKTYEVTNNNSDYIATPRTKKEIKKHNKQLRKQAKKRLKEAKKNLN